MVQYGHKSLPYKDFCNKNYGWIRLATVHQLWFTRERSKVRSLVRPPFTFLNHNLLRKITDARRLSSPVQIKNSENNPMHSSRPQSDQ
ncbi:hypothetical protein ACVWZ6_008350 [Bradyrhizobium sp. GM6.1]